MWRRQADVARSFKDHIVSAMKIDGCFNAVVSHRAVNHMGSRKVCDKDPPTTLTLWCRRPKHALLLAVTQVRDVNMCIIVGFEWFQTQHRAVVWVIACSHAHDCYPK
jgi:hypothetical protein